MTPIESSADEPMTQVPRRPLEGAALSTVSAIDAQEIRDTEQASELSVGVCPSGPGIVTEPAYEPARTGPSVVTSFWTLQASHTIVDIYPMFFASLMLAFKDRLGLDNWQVAMLFATGPIVSGLPQAFFAWASDRFDTRFCGWFGLGLGAIAISSIGFTQNFWQLWALQVIGLLGTGMYHPIAAALAGQLGGRMKANRATGHGRAWAVSVFYTAGMVGGFLGAILCTRINKSLGMEHLAWLIPPGLVAGAALWWATRGLAHRHAGHHEIHASISASEQRARWFAVWMLFIGNVVRFTVNTALPVLFTVWAEHRISNDVELATKLNGDMLAALTVGMGIFGLSAGRLSPPGREKRSILILTVIGAATVGVIGYAGTHLGVWAVYISAAMSALGFAAVIPTSISLAQRLLPGRTGLASGLMLGTSWGLSFTAPWLAEFAFGASINDAHTLPASRIDAAFLWFGGLMLVALATTLAMPSWLLRKVAKEH